MHRSSLGRRGRWVLLLGGLACVMVALPVRAGILADLAEKVMNSAEKDAATVAARDGAAAQALPRPGSALKTAQSTDNTIVLETDKAGHLRLHKANAPAISIRSATDVFQASRPIDAPILVTYSAAERFTPQIIAIAGKRPISLLDCQSKRWPLESQVIDGRDTLLVREAPIAQVTLQTWSTTHNLNCPTYSAAHAADKTNSDPTVSQTILDVIVLIFVALLASILWRRRRI